jgi:hypothetical protein
MGTTMLAPDREHQAAASDYLAGIRQLVAGAMLSEADRARLDQAAKLFSIEPEQLKADVEALRRLAALRADLAKVESRRASDRATVAKAQVEIDAAMATLSRARETVARDQARAYAAALLKVQITALAAEILDSLGDGALAETVNQ